MEKQRMSQEEALHFKILDEDITAAQHVVKQMEGYAGLAAMKEAACAEFLSQDELDEMEQVFVAGPSTFIDADDPEAVADPDAEFEYRFDGISASPAKTKKALTHNSMVLSERVKRMCRQVIDRCRDALRYRTHAGHQDAV